MYSEWADEVVYECCRLIGILYSTAVILGLPPHVGWHLQLCAQIRRHLEACDMEELSGDARGLLIWISFVASIAAYGSEYQDFFFSALRSVLEIEGLESRLEAEHVLKGYLWSSYTCGEGGALVWEALGLSWRFDVANASAIDEEAPLRMTRLLRCSITPIDTLCLNGQIRGASVSCSTVIN